MCLLGQHASIHPVVSTTSLYLNIIRSHADDFKVDGSKAQDNAAAMGQRHGCFCNSGDS